MPTGEGQIAAIVTAICSLIMSLTTSGAVFRFILQYRADEKARKAAAEKAIEERNLAHGRLLAEREHMIRDLAERDRLIGILQDRIGQQGETTYELISLLSDVGAVIREEKIESQGIAALWKRWELIRVQIHTSNLQSTHVDSGIEADSVPPIPPKSN